LRHNVLFESMGWRVAPFAMHHSNNINSRWSDFFVEEIEFGSDYSLWEKLGRVPKVIYSFEAQRKVANLLDVFPADVCHAHNIYHHISPSILKTIKQRDIPIVMTLHDLKLACPAYNMLAQDGVCERCKGGRIHNVLLQRCIKESTALSAIVMIEALLHKMLRTFEQCVDRFIVPSRFYINKFVEWGWDRERFVYIPNAIDMGVFSPDYNPGKSFIYFGRLSREKGLSTLVKAASHAGVPLRIVGTGPDEQSLRKLSEATGADVTFLGYLKGQALHDVIRSAKAVVLPSEWYENAPLSILEAYALGKPVIGADIGGIPEMIRPEETGFTFSSGSTDELADVLKKVSGLSEYRISEMGRNGRAWAEDEFSHEKYRDRMLALYQQLGISC
jgi:glycosyltransferase involved in cell wall biosynthesis